MELLPPRGSIFDARGRELALSVDVDSLWADPSRVEEMLREAGFIEFTGTSRGPETHLIARKQPVV